jgi:hypothetical protein
VQINMYPGVVELMHKRFAELAASIRDEIARRTPLPNGQTLLELPAATDLQGSGETGKNNCWLHSLNPGR